MTSGNAYNSSNKAMDWHSIDWKRVYRYVRKLQLKIAKAATAGQWHEVRDLVRLLTRSFSAKAMAVRRVTENQGKKTPGVDGEIWDTPEKKWQAISRLRYKGYRPKPLRRIYVPKAKGGQRPLSIPVMLDRAMQALWLLALDPVAETYADTNSYGFRRERSCADAIGQCYIVIGKHNSPQWMLEGDIKACFDSISHEWLVDKTRYVGNIIRKWLKAGYSWKRQLFPTEQGTPQGGIASPTLANITLDGLEPALHSQFRHRMVNLVRYADDLVVTADSEETAKEVKQAVAEFLSPRGLELSESKTFITHIANGFDFLGQNVRKYQGKLLIKPAKANVKKFLAKIKATIKKFATATQGQLIKQLNPKIQGWVNYHRHVVSKQTFAKVDAILWRKIWNWCKRRHPNKSKSWVKSKYFHKAQGSNWCFTVQEGGRTYTLVRASHTAIRRHVKIQGVANPYDPAYEQYFEKRDTHKWENNCYVVKLRSLWKRQNGRCPSCQQRITLESGWECHHKIHRSKGGRDTLDNLVLLHPDCHHQLHFRKKTGSCCADEAMPSLITA